MYDAIKFSILPRMTQTRVYFTLGSTSMGLGHVAKLPVQQLLGVRLVHIPGENALQSFALKHCLAQLKEYHCIHTLRSTYSQAFHTSWFYRFRRACRASL